MLVTHKRSPLSDHTFNVVISIGHGNDSVSTTLRDVLRPALFSEFKILDLLEPRGGLRLPINPLQLLIRVRFNRGYLCPELRDLLVPCIGHPCDRPRPMVDLSIQQPLQRYLPGSEVSASGAVDLPLVLD